MSYIFCIFVLKTKHKNETDVKNTDFNLVEPKIITKEQDYYIRYAKIRLYNDGSDVYCIESNDLMRLVDLCSKGGFADVVRYVKINDRTFGVNREQIMLSLAEFFASMSYKKKSNIFGTGIALDTKDDFIHYFRECGYFDNYDIETIAMKYFNKKYIYSGGMMKRKAYETFYDYIK